MSLNHLKSTALIHDHAYRSNQINQKGKENIFNQQLLTYMGE